MRRENRVKRQRMAAQITVRCESERRKAVHLGGAREVVEMKPCIVGVVQTASFVYMTVNLTLLSSTIMFQLTAMVQTHTHICSNS